MKWSLSIALLLTAFGPCRTSSLKCSCGESQCVSSERGRAMLQVRMEDSEGVEAKEVAISSQMSNWKNIFSHEQGAGLDTNFSEEATGIILFDGSASDSINPKITFNGTTGLFKRSANVSTIGFADILSRNASIQGADTSGDHKKKGTLKEQRRAKLASVSKLTEKAAVAGDPIRDNTVRNNAIFMGSALLASFMICGLQVSAWLKDETSCHSEDLKRDITKVPIRGDDANQRRFNPAKASSSKKHVWFPSFADPTPKPYIVRAMLCRKQQDLNFAIQNTQGHDIFQVIVSELVSEQNPGIFLKSLDGVAAHVFLSTRNLWSTPERSTLSIHKASSGSVCFCTLEKNSSGGYHLVREQCTLMSFNGDFQHNVVSVITPDGRVIAIAQPITEEHYCVRLDADVDASLIILSMLGLNKLENM